MKNKLLSFMLFVGLILSCSDNHTPKPRGFFKFDFISSIRRLVYFENILKVKEKKEINQKSLISIVKK